MRLLYSFFIRLYYCGIFLAQAFNPKAKKWIQGRKSPFKDAPIIPENRQVIWFHCASLGEFDQGLPLMNLLKEKDSTIFLLVTFFSPSGFEHYQKRKNQVDFACYLPLDTKSNAKAFLAKFKPTKLFLVKYEFWSNFIFECKNYKVKTYSICTILREKHRFFKWYGSFFRETLRKIDYFFVQNESTLNLLHSIGITKAKITGDLRFDRVLENKNNVENDPIIQSFSMDNNIWILGSSWQVDELFLQDAIRKFIHAGKVIIAPHDISEKHIQQIESLFSNLTKRYTTTKEENEFSERILILDCIGKLSNAYSYANFAYIGGGFTGSLHNILEPAVFGLPVIFGPKHSRFPEAQLFLDAKVAFCVEDNKSLHEALELIDTNSTEIHENLEVLIKSNAGSSEKIYEILQ